jgi:hypothetical protein
MLYASASNTLSKLAAVATGKVLRSKGTSTAPAWEQVNLTTDVTGTLPVANGGTGDTGTAWTSYTPTVTSQTNSPPTSVSATGLYKTIGKTVHVQVQIVITTNGTASGNIYFTLPVNIASSGFYYGIAREEAGVASNSQGYVRFASDDTTKAGILSMTSTYMGGSGAVIRASGTYQSA